VIKAGNIFNMKKYPGYIPNSFTTLFFYIFFTVFFTFFHNFFYLYIHIYNFFIYRYVWLNHDTTPFRYYFLLVYYLQFFYYRFLFKHFSGFRGFIFSASCKVISHEVVLKRNLVEFWFGSNYILHNDFNQLQFFIKFTCRLRICYNKLCNKI